MKCNQTALITGASRGIGLILARLFAKDGYNLLLIARSEETLQSIKKELESSFNIKVYILSKDLSHESSPQEILDYANSENLQVNFLVNNAGFGDWGFFSESNQKKLEDMIKLNVLSLMTLTKLFLPQMIARKEGKILNVASIASFMPGAKMSVYYATKAFVRSFSEGLSLELKKTKSGVSVTVLCPGPVKTNFWTRAEAEKSSLSKHIFFEEADFIAKYGYKSLMKGKLLAIPGILTKIMVLSARILPYSITRNLVYFIQK